MVLKNENFDEIVKEGIVLVDFYASWCGPCKMQSPILESLEEDVKIIKIDVDEHDELARRFGIMSIPTLILFKDGKEIRKNIGLTPKEVILSWIEEN